MEQVRDLACVELWQASLERSLARRHKPARCSIELRRLVPRDLASRELVRESATYWQLRRRAAKRLVMSSPGIGGVSSVLALLAATTLPSLLGNRGGGKRPAHVSFRMDGHLMRAAAVHDSLTGTTASTAAEASTATASRAASAATTTTSVHTSAATAIQPRVRTSGAVAHASGGVGLGIRRAVRGQAAPQLIDHGVKGLQQLLHVTVDGIFGPITERAVKHFQATHGLTVTGVVGAATRVALGLGPGPVLRPVHDSQTVKPVSARSPRAGAGPTSVVSPKTGAKPARPGVSPAPTIAPGGYVNPLARASLTPERIDMGVDYSGTGTLTALGAGTVTYVGTSGTGWPGAFVEYRLTGGGEAGRYVYYAEGVRPVAGLHVGETVRPGQLIVTLIPGYSDGIEIGWGAGVGTETYAEQQGEWSSRDDEDSVPTAAGKNFSALIASLGGPPGKIEG